MKKLTVLVPSYNFANYIIECIDSIYRQQTNFDFDVIVRDDCSIDNTNEKLIYLQKKYPSLIVLDGSKNLGSFGNIKLLYETSNSEYIAYLDGDDTFGDVDKLQRQVDFLDNNPEYVMHFTGSRYLHEDGTIFPDDSRVICSVKKIINTKDLLESNYVGFGRMFRKIPNIFKDNYKDLPYVDWPTSYELSKHGLIIYEEFFGGLYRISDDGMYSKSSDEEKEKGADIVREVINKDYFDQNYKCLTVVDCFISNDSVLSKLSICLKRLKNQNFKTLLITNTIPPQHIIEMTNYLIYNKDNKLFNEKYENVGFVDLWKSYDGMVIHEITEELQRHGLSVMSNLFNSLDFAKSLGYTHFQRIEVDDLFTDEGYEFMKNIPKTVDKNNKSALFYFNHNDVSFHYMFSEINFFLNNVYRITDEKSYRDYLKNNGFGNEFKPVEVYLHHNLIKTNSNQILIKNGEEEMNKDFPNTTWNSETSQSTLPDYFEGCTTKIYNVKDQNNFVVLSYNYTNKLIDRKIIIELENSEEIIYHKLEKSNSWSYHMFDRPIQKIKVYNSLNDELLYEMENKNIHSYIEFT
jgi:glycosyltransferase involved in cell wall biosynthesis